MLAPATVSPVAGRLFLRFFGATLKAPRRKPSLASALPAIVAGIFVTRWHIFDCATRRNG